MTTFHRAKHLLLVAAAGSLGGCLQPNPGTDSESETSSSSESGSGPIETTETSATDTSSTTEDPTTGTIDPPPTCGDGEIGGMEQCDDGEGNGADAPCTPECTKNVCGDGHLWISMEECDDGQANADDAACTSQCKDAVCGDGHVLADVEVCDDAKNDGTYNSCAADCSARGPHCGDSVLDPEEECDSDDPACLSSCMLARSCLLIHDADPDLQSGPRTIYPVDPTTPVEVFCDMTTDGGGYTFLKVDIDSDVNDLPYTAKKAEGKCGEYGMRLFIPRSPNHLATAYGVATVDNVAPVGGGVKSSGVDYLQILGIYPVDPNLSCLGEALNPDDCPEWAASDMGPWYISETSKNAAEPDPDGACLGCSLIYTWNLDGSVKNYKTLPAPGGSSLRFMCDTGDKLPRP